jgi:hypothetical protein
VSVKIEAPVDLVADKPEIVEMPFSAQAALTCAKFQRDFQWPDRWPR